MVYPTITTDTLQMINCIKIDGVIYLKSNFQIKCWTKDHYFLLAVIALPITIIWILGFPIFVFFILRKNRPFFNEKNTIVKYGFYYIGLNDGAYYWEVLVINARKIFLSAIAASLST